MDTKKIRALLTALDTGSLTAAAEELGYTQSGLTHMMNSLEDELGVKLLVRSKGGVRLSPAGRELLPQMNALMQCADELQRSVDRLIQRRFTVLRLGAYSSVARQWLPAILSELRRTAPEIDVSITTGGMRDIYAAVKNDELDCAIISYQESLCQGMKWVALRDDPLLAILPADFELDGGSFPVKLFEGREFLMPADDFELDILPVLDNGGGFHISASASGRQPLFFLSVHISHGGLRALHKALYAPVVLKVLAHREAETPERRRRKRYRQHLVGYSVHYKLRQHAHAQPVRGH